jgi:hypothetical protein
VTTTVIPRPAATKPPPLPCPPLESDYPVAPEQIATYQRDGHILLRGVAAPEEVAPYRAVLTDMTNEFAKHYKPLHERDTYGKAFIQFTNLWTKTPRPRASRSRAASPGSPPI